MKKLIISLVLAGGVCLAAAGAAVDTQQQMLSEKMVRLHVIANSDSDYDQNLKLQARDAVLSLLSKYRWTTREEALKWLTENLESVCQAAAAPVHGAGQQLPVKVTLGEETYPVREYETFSLPSGKYLSLRIVIGDGYGENWWCVVYPSICTPISVEELREKAVSAGFSQEEISFITEDSTEIRIKFKLLDWLQQLSNFFSCR